MCAELREARCALHLAVCRMSILNKADVCCSKSQGSRQKAPAADPRQWGGVCSLQPCGSVGPHEAWKEGMENAPGAQKALRSQLAPQGGGVTDAGGAQETFSCCATGHGLVGKYWLCVDGWNG